jgi:hypothetical protein
MAAAMATGAEMALLMALVLLLFLLLLLLLQWAVAGPALALVGLLSLLS